MCHSHICDQNPELFIRVLFLSVWWFFICCFRSCQRDRGQMNVKRLRVDLLWETCWRSRVTAVKVSERLKTHTHSCKWYFDNLISRPAWSVRFIAIIIDQGVAFHHAKINIIYHPCWWLANDRPARRSAYIRPHRPGWDPCPLDGFKVVVKMCVERWICWSISNHPQMHNNHQSRYVWKE